MQARMQPLHNAHLRLIDKALEENDRVLVVHGVIPRQIKKDPRRFLGSFLILFNRADSLVLETAFFYVFVDDGFRVFPDLV